MQNKEQCSLDSVVRAGRCSYPGHDALVIGWYTCRDYQEKLLNTLTNRRDGEITGSILNGKDRRLPKSKSLLEIALESTLMGISTGKRSTEMKL